MNGVTVVLHAFRNGAELSGSPLNPDYGPTMLTDTRGLRAPRCASSRRSTPQSSG
jgi:hypothetical protein